MSVQGDDVTVANLVENAEDLSDADLNRIRAIALADRLVINRLISPSADVTGVMVTILLPRHSGGEVSQVAAFARKLADGLRQTHPNIDVYLTGMVMFDNAYAEVSQDDLYTLGPFMFLVLVLITALSLRSVMGTFAVLLIIVMSVVTGIGRQQPCVQ